MKQHYIVIKSDKDGVILSHVLGQVKINGKYYLNFKVGDNIELR